MVAAMPGASIKMPPAECGRRGAIALEEREGDKETTLSSGDYGAWTANVKSLFLAATG